MSRIVSAGYNLGEDTSCGLDAVGDLPGVAVGLLPLRDTGVPGAAHFPVDIGSPARDAGQQPFCALSPELTHDQLRTPRDDGHCDIGAIEFTPPIF